MYMTLLENTLSKSIFTIHYTDFFLDYCMLYKNTQKDKKNLKIPMRFLGHVLMLQFCRVKFKSFT